MRQHCEFFWFGQTWKCLRISRDEDIFGGECNLAEKTIEINAKYDQETFLDYLHHELMEGATFLNGCSFSKMYPDKEDITVMNHTQMDIVSGAVRGAYEEVRRKIIPENHKRSEPKRTKKAAIKKTATKKPRKKT